MDDYFRISRNKLYTKKGEPRKVIKCRWCDRLSMRVFNVNRTFISGDGYYYKCSCGCTERRIL